MELIKLGAQMPSIQKSAKLVVLILSAYPFQQPRNGAQVRVAEVAAIYASSGCEVHSVAIYEPEKYSTADIGAHDVAFPSDSPFRQYRGKSIPLINDFLAGGFAASNDGAYTAICADLPPVVDVIHLEQPWLLPLAQRLRAETTCCASACLVYGSQNIEKPLKESILRSCQVDGAADALTDIGALERRAACAADLVLAVTSDDLLALQAFGAREVLLAPNGVSPRQAPADRIDYWRSKLPTVPWLLYVGSAYPPNYTGFVECVGDSLACIPPDSRLVVVGGVGQHLQDLLGRSPSRSINLSRLTILGMLDDDDFAAVKSLAHAFLLPIQAGGGSNLKTAEAIYSGKQLICSRVSLRGFEHYADLLEVTVAENPHQFQQAIHNVLATPRHSNARVPEDDGRRQLEWKHCLGAVPVEVKRILDEIKAAR